MAQKLVHKRSSQALKAPTGATLDYGEIAVNYNVESPFLSIKNSDNTYSKFSSDDIIAAGMVEYVSGELKLKSDTGHTHDDRYYTETEVDAKIKAVNDTIEDNELITSAALNELNERVLGTAPAIHTHKKSDITDFEHTHGTVTLTGDVTGSASFGNGGATITTTIAKNDMMNHMISVTYDELVALRNNNQLIPGQQYRITDYVTTTVQENTKSAGHPFDVIVLALSENTLAEEAYAIQREFNIEDYKEAYSPSWSERMAYIGTYEYRGKIYHRYESASQDMQMLVDFKTITFSDGWTNNNDLKERYPFVFIPTFAKSDEDWDTGENFGEVIAFKNYPEYFADSDLNAWQIWYSLDNDIERFAWALSEDKTYVICHNTSSYFPAELEGRTIEPVASTTDVYLHDSKVLYIYNLVDGNLISFCENGSIIDEGESNVGYYEVVIGKGVIYRMIDEWNNDCPYDFKNIMFERRLIEGRLDEDDGEVTYCYTFNAYNNDSEEMEDASIISFKQIFNGDYNRCYGNIIKEHKFEQESKTIILNDIVFLNILDKLNEDIYFHCFSNTFGDDCYSNTFGNSCFYNTFGDGCYSNCFRKYCTNNSFGNNCYSNSFEDECKNNSFGNMCCNNGLGDYCSNNIFGNNCRENQFFSDCSSNSFSNDCSQNSFGNDCKYNGFSNDCHINTFGNNCRYNSFGNGCYHNSFEYECRNNSFGNGCYYNEFGNYCYSNSFGNSCYNNSFEYECCNNSFGNGCYENYFGGSCDSNSFGDDCCRNSLGFYCDFNSFGNYCDSNYFGNYCCYNSFGNGCYSNRFGYHCYSNSFGNECCYNSFRSSASKTSSLKDYCHYNHFDDGCSYNVIWNSNTTGSSNNLQNINVNRGVSGTSSNYNFINIDTIKSEQEINVNQVDGIVSIGEVLSIKYESLKTLRDNSKLIPGRQYRIIDYNTTTSQENTTSAERKFDIIVTAIDDCTLSEEAQVIQNIDDAYFDDSNLSAWKVWYSLDNDTERFAWAGNEKIETTEVEVLDTSNCTISVPYHMDDEVELSELDTWVRVQGKVFNDPSDADFYEEGSDMNEIFSHWGYTEDANGITQLTMYARDIDGDLDNEWEDAGLNLGERYHYKGVDIVNDVEYDIWAQFDDDLTYSEGSLGPVYVLTERIVSGEPTIITTTIETVIQLEPKGVIYRMIDEFGNDCPYDFKNIMFIRYELNAPETVDTELWMNQLSTNIQAQFSNNKLPYIWGGFVHSGRYWEDEYNEIYSISTGNKKAFYTFSTVINGTVTDHSMLQDYCYDNTIKEYIVSKKQHLNNNVFLNISKTTACYSNSFGNNCFRNSIGNSCYSNSFGNGCADNSFGNSCNSNSFGNSCYSNSFGGSCVYNYFGNSCYSNSFGNNCRSNTFGSSCYSNSFGNDCDNNSFGSNCYSNSFGNNCDNNSFGNTCDNNSFGNNCDNNSFGNTCDNNSFGDYCCYNSFGNTCDNNSFGDNCYRNSFENDCNYNSFRSSASNTASLKNYVHYNHFDDGCSYNVIWTSGTTASNRRLQNINVNRGVSGTGSSHNMINITTIDQDYEIQVAKNSKGEIKIYCEADLIA